MRYVHFSRKFVFKYPGDHVYEDAIVFGDVDNDGENELVVGTEQGYLSVYKRQYTWQTLSDHDGRPIRGVGVGNILNIGNTNYVVAISQMGLVVTYLCLVEEGQEDRLRPIHRQYLRGRSFGIGHPSVERMMLAPVQGCIKNDLVVGYSDRHVRIYRWQQTPLDYNYVCHMECVPCAEFGNLSAMTLLFTKEGREPFFSKSTVASQPGPSYILLKVSGMLINYFVMTGLNLPADCLPENLEGGFCRVLCDFGPDNSFALSHLEGFVYLINKHSRLLWMYKLDDSIFSLRQANMKNDDTSHLLAASWSGNTYIMDYHGNITCFDAGGRIQAFNVGRYGRVGLSLAYATYDRKIVIYYGVDMKKMVIRSFTDVLSASSPAYAKYTREQLAELARYCMYYLEPTGPEVKIEPIPFTFEPEPSCSYQPISPRPIFLEAQGEVVVPHPLEGFPPLVREPSLMDAFEKMATLEEENVSSGEENGGCAEAFEIKHVPLGNVVVGDVVVGSVVIENAPSRLMNVAEENVPEEGVAEEIVPDDNVAEEIVPEGNVAQEDVAQENVAQEDVAQEDVAQENVDEENDDEENGDVENGHLGNVEQDSDDDTSDDFDDISDEDSDSGSSQFSGSPNE